MFPEKKAGPDFSSSWKDIFLSVILVHLFSLLLQISNGFIEIQFYNIPVLFFLIKKSLQQSNGLLLYHAPAQKW